MSISNKLLHFPCSPLLLAGFMILSPIAAFGSGQLVLRCWPGRLVAKRNTPVYVHVALENVTFSPVQVTVWLNPIPAPGEPIHPLRMKCVDVKTRHTVRYTGIPGKVAMPKEEPVSIPEGCFIGATFDLSRVCQLPPGVYALKLWYDTSQLHQIIPINRNAWHSVTNSVTIKVTILR